MKSRFNFEKYRALGYFEIICKQIKGLFDINDKKDQKTRPYILFFLPFIEIVLEFFEF